MSQTVRDEKLEILGMFSIIGAVFSCIFGISCFVKGCQTQKQNEKGPEIEIKLNK